MKTADQRRQKSKNTPAGGTEPVRTDAFRRIGPALLGFVEDVDPAHERISRVWIPGEENADGSGMPRLFLRSHLTGTVVEFVLAIVRLDGKGRIEGWEYHPDNPDAAKGIRKVMITNC